MQILRPLPRAWRGPEKELGASHRFSKQAPPPPSVFHRENAHLPSMVKSQCLALHLSPVGLTKRYYHTGYCV